MITIMGATGRIGLKIATRLLDAGEPVRALGRSKAGLERLAAAGAETMPGDASDAGYLARAFRGADAAFTMMPYDPAAPDFDLQQRSYGEAIAQAVRESGLRHVVALSSVGAHLAEGNGPIAALHEQEERLRGISGIALLFLRPAAFFENFDAAPAMIREQGGIVDAYAPDVPVPMVATADIARVAAQALRRRDWHATTVQEVLGPREISYREATRIIGNRIGRPDLPYVQMAHGAWVEALVAAGMSPSVAGALTELARAISEGRVKSTAAHDATTRMAGRFEDYVAGLLPV